MKKFFAVLFILIGLFFVPFGIGIPMVILGARELNEKSE